MPLRHRCYSHHRCVAVDILMFIAHLLPRRYQPHLVATPGPTTRAIAACSVVAVPSKKLRGCRAVAAATLSLRMPCCDPHPTNREVNVNVCTALACTLAFSFAHTLTCAIIIACANRPTLARAQYFPHAHKVTRCTHAANLAPLRYSAHLQN